MKLNISVIGAGVGGLASAIRMAVRGHEVTVYEQAPGPGGKMGELRWEGFRWDAGPSLFTLPELMEELYLIAQEEMKATSGINQLEIITKYFYEDGLVLNAYGDPEKFIEEAATKTGENPKNIRKFLNKARAIYNLTKDVFIFGDFSSLKTFTSAKFLRAALQIYKLQILSTMHSKNRRRFKSDHLVQLFDRYATYNGSNPYRAPGTLNLISHLEHNLGAFFPENGMHSLSRVLCALAEKLGVNFRFNTRVEEIILHKNVVEGVFIGKDVHEADIVISDVDIYYLYKDLLPETPLPEKYFRAERSTSAMIFYWAMDKHYPELDLHNVLFSADYKNEFEQLFRRFSISEDPTIYIFISAKQVKNDAPGGKENWFVMINTPANNGQDWDSMITRARSAIIKKIERILGKEVGKHILHEIVRDPRNIEDETFSYMGSLYGNSSNSRLAAFSRHPNYRKDIQGLYFVGGSVHPGGGVPLCLASARIVDQQIVKHYE